MDARDIWNSKLHIHTTNTVTTWSLCMGVDLQSAEFEHSKWHPRLTTSQRTPPASWPRSSDSSLSPLNMYDSKSFEELHYHQGMNYIAQYASSVQYDLSKVLHAIWMNASKVIAFVEILKVKLRLKCFLTLKEIIWIGLISEKDQSINRHFMVNSNNSF